MRQPVMEYVFDAESAMIVRSFIPAAAAIDEKAPS
jgi:hypothetical protein